jgi:hypothetical protein
MKALLFLAVFALATQVHNSEITEFYRTFVNNIPMDTQSKNQIMNDGLECINLAQNAIFAAVGKVQQDLYNNNVINALRDVIGSAEVLEKVVLPKCAQTYMELAFYLQSHADHSKLDSMVKIQLFQTKMISLFAKTALNAVGGANSGAVAKDLAILVDTAFGLIDANLPTVMEFDYSKYVPMVEEKALPLFFKGLFNGLGVYDNAKIEGTSQCVLSVISSLKTIFTNPALQRGDFYTKANTFLDSLMPLTDSFEKCQKLNTVDMEMFKRLITMFKTYPLLTFMRIQTNTLLEYPDIMANQINVGVLMTQGQYEQAGQLYANIVRTVYTGILF